MLLVRETVVEFAVEPMQIPLQLRPVLADNASLFQGKNVALGRVGQVFCVLSSELSLKEGRGSTVYMLSVSCLVSCSDSNKSFTFPFENRKNIHRFAVSPNGLLMITADEGQLISNSTRKPLL